MSTQSTQTQVHSIGREYTHDSARLHVQGQAHYIDDMPVPHGCLHIALALSPYSKGIIKQLDTSKVESSPGVVDVLTAAEIPHLYIGAIKHDEPLLADTNILFSGQALCAVLATSEKGARRAARQLRLQVSEQSAIVSIDQAIANNSYLEKPLCISTGDSDRALAQSQHQLQGELYIGGQEHYYLETQIALAIPGDDEAITVHSSTQNPSEVQHLIAHTLGVSQHSVEVITRRMGGGFGGKETDSSQIACLSALLARKHGKAVKCRLPRHEDILLTGKRHDFKVVYKVGFDNQGVINGISIDYYARCGYSLDLSSAIVARCLFHADNAYYLENATFTGHMCKTNTCSNTAFRGFGGPQGMVAIENILETIAQHLQLDALAVRQANYYQPSKRNCTPYGQLVEDNLLQPMTRQLLEQAQYISKVQAIEEYNRNNPYLKKGLGFTPVKFGISFTTTFLNQAGALVHLYKDGSIYLNHGGTEMGQGLFIKVAQVVAAAFGVDVAAIKVSATNTSKIPNTSATAASSGTDLNAMAAQVACDRIKTSLADFAISQFDVDAKDIVYANGTVQLGDQNMAFGDFVHLAYINRVELFSNGFYATPKIHYDVETGKGRPFYYFAYGVCLSEVVVDTLTGEYKVLDVHILHDVGHSLNPAIDRGQIVGGFFQGLGWLTTEEVVWNESGKLLTTGASTYKIPAIGDLPEHFTVELLQGVRNNEETIYRSKAVGEPPLMLAISVWLALQNAIYRANPVKPVHLDTPASVERVYFAIRKQLDEAN